MDDRTVLALLLLFGIGLVVWFAFCAALLALTRALSAVARGAAHMSRAAWEWAVAWLLFAAAGPVDAGRDAYAARALYTNRTPGGPR